MASKQVSIEMPGQKQSTWNSIDLFQVINGEKMFKEKFVYEIWF
jgi:hypothetical protein